MPPTGVRLVLALLILTPQAALADTIELVSDIVLLSYVGLAGLGYAGLVIFCVWKCVRKRPPTDIAYHPIDSPPSNAYTVSVVPTDELSPEFPTPPLLPSEKGPGYFSPSGVLPTDDQYNSEGYDQPMLCDPPSTVVLPSHDTAAVEPAAEIKQRSSPPVYDEPITTISTPTPEIKPQASSVGTRRNSPPPPYDSIYAS